MVIMVIGLPGSGKSFFASRLAELLHADYISSDKLRVDMLSKRSYSNQEKELIYDEMLKQMEYSIQRQRNVVLDATFYTSRLREKCKEKVNDSVALAVIEVWASEAAIKNRLSHGREFSEADFGIYKMIKSQWEPLTERHLTLESTQGNLHIMLQKAIRYLHLIKNEKRAGQ